MGETAGERWEKAKSFALKFLGLVILGFKKWCKKSGIEIDMPNNSIALLCKKMKNQHYALCCKEYIYKNINGGKKNGGGG